MPGEGGGGGRRRAQAEADHSYCESKRDLRDKYFRRWKNCDTGMKVEKLTESIKRYES